ncbi:MAG: glutathione peroxidase [bacterium]|nr:glutathione peroxidase [bacterium]
MNIYDFIVKNITGIDEKLEKYSGKVLLIVNTATECGFTPQYTNLQQLYDKYSSKGLEILDFPCNQFGHQAPGTEKEIATFCSARFGVTFPQFAKIDVNGENQSGLFKYLKSQQKFNGFDLNSKSGAMMHEVLLKMDPDYEKNDDIKWNFTKFLVDKSGNVVKRFEPTDDINIVEEAITRYL